MEKNNPQHTTVHKWDHPYMHLTNVTRFPSSVKDKYNSWIPLPDKLYPMLCHKIAQTRSNTFPNGPGPKRFMVFPNTWNHPHRQTSSIRPQRHISLHDAKFPQSAKAGMYTKAQRSEFWDAILMSSASKNALQKFTGNLIVPSNAKKGPDGYTHYAPWTDFFVDNMISPKNFDNEFVQTFGTIG